MTEHLAASAHDDRGAETEDDHLLERVRRSFEQTVGGSPGPLFTTDADLWPLFLASLPEEKRQEYTCGACRTFIERFGGLATVEEDGKGPHSVFWRQVEQMEPRTPTFDRACAALAAAVSRAAVTGVFLTRAETWGKPVTGSWRHFAVTPPASLLHRHLVLSPEQLMAERREDFDILSRALDRYPLKLVRNAHQILSTGDHLYRAEKVLGVAAWLLALQERLKGSKDKRKRDRIVWRAVATAPPGFAHVNTTMIGTLLEDLAEGLAFAQVSRRFAQKMHPLQYQRPTAEPSATQIAQAEKAVAALQAAGALERRFARLDDVEALWKPTDTEPSGASGGVFQHLKPKGRRSPAAAVEAPAAKITWEKFRRTVLPEAQEIELHMPPGRIDAIALTTAVHPEAQPILQWDRDDRRNPVSWYVYHGGGSPQEWNLSPSTWVRVEAICLLPPLWGRDTPHEHHGQGAILLLQGARDLRWQENGGGMGFFPEQLRTELHPFRKTLEAYARQATVAGGKEPMAAGIDLRKGVDWHGAQVRVTSRNGRALYVLDRWD